MLLTTTARPTRRAAALAMVVLATAGCGAVAPQRQQDPPAASAGRPGRPRPVVRRFPSRVYVPNSGDGTVDVIDPATRRVVDHFSTGRLPQHVVPSLDLRRLWITNDQSNSLTPVLRVVRLEPGSMPQDVKLAPDGQLFYVADMRLNGVHLVDAAAAKVAGFVPTGAGAHGLYLSRDSRYLYASNRDEGSISVLSFATRKVVATWRLPGGGSPDMGGVSADGRVLWLTGRYNAQVYAIDTRTGALLARIKVGQGPHGLYVYPQPGRYSPGHTGVFR